VGVDGNTHAAALSGLNLPTQPVKDCKMSMTPEEKAEFDQLKADKAALEQEVADLKKRKKKADVDGKLSAAGFKQNAEGKFSGLSDATYSMLLSADDNTLAAVIADLAPKNEQTAGWLMSETHTDDNKPSGNALLDDAAARSKGGAYV